MFPIKSEELNALVKTRQFDLAIKGAQAALKSDMKSLVRWAELASVFHAAGRMADSERVLDDAIRRFDHPFLFCMRAYVKHTGKNYDGALSDLREAEQRSPNDVMVLNNLTAALLDRNQHEEALRYLERILTMKPDHAEALSNLSTVYLKLEQFDDALAVKKKQLAIQPDNPDVYLGLLNQLRKAGHLTEYGATFDLQRVKKTCEQARSFETFHALYFMDDPAWHLHLARRQALKTPAYKLSAQPCVTPAKARLKIGYWSCDYYDHATAQLISEVFELHDRGTYEIFILSYGAVKSDPARERIRASAEHFLDFANVSDADAVDRIAALDLDIFIDLKGYTASTRMAVPFARPAPIIVSWLGYPGTLGTKNVDYIIGDAVVTPFGSERHYDEKIVQLPSSYQPNDSKQAIAPALDKATYGLPEDRIILAAFNGVHKITPEIFDVWMRVLKQNPELCLWLFAGQKASFQQLVREAELRGVDSRQLVHAGKMKRPDHIARYKVADLALDCFPYGSHTTGSDALRCGCPLLALMGESFASRVSGSLLTAVDLPELITTSAQEYEEKLTSLTSSPEKLRTLRKRLEQAQSLPLYDTPAFVRGLEEAYQLMWKRHAQGLPPANISVSAERG